jgi:hypothetical protein
MKKTILFLILPGLFLVANAQKKSAAKLQNIKSVTEYKLDLEKNNGAKVKESYILFDSEGNTLEEIEYDVTGKTTLHMKYQYDNNNNKIKEIEIAPNGKPSKTIEYKYTGNVRTEKNVYDGTGKLKSKRVYQYEFLK